MNFFKWRHFSHKMKLIIFYCKIKMFANNFRLILLCPCLSGGYVALFHYKESLEKYSLCQRLILFIIIVSVFITFIFFYLLWNFVVVCKGWWFDMAVPVSGYWLYCVDFVELFVCSCMQVQYFTNIADK